MLSWRWGAVTNITEVGGGLEAHQHTHTYLSLQPVPVVAEQAEAVQLVLWRGAAGAAPVARLMSGFRARRRSLGRTNTHTATPHSADTVTVLVALLPEA